MTRKEKKAEALRLKAQIEAKHTKPEPTPEEKEKQKHAEWKKYDERKYRKKRKPNKQAYFDATGKNSKPKEWDFDKW